MLPQDGKIGVWLNQYDNKYSYDANNFIYKSVSKAFNAAGNMVTSGDSIIAYYHTVTVGISSVGKNSNQLKIYPNPSNGKFTVELEHGSLTNVEIYTSTGQKLVQQKSGAIDMSSFPEGVYVVRVVDNERAYTKRIVIN